MAGRSRRGPKCERSQLVARDERRPAGADLTLFKAMGSGVADLALGLEVSRARGARRGCAIPSSPKRARVRLRKE